MRVRDVRLALRNTELPEATRELIDIAPGDIYSPEAIRRSIRPLFALDKFSDIKVEADRVDNGQEVDVELLSTAAERIRSLLREEGFLWAEVEPEASFESPTATVCRFHLRAESHSKNSGSSDNVQYHSRLRAINSLSSVRFLSPRDAIPVSSTL